MKNPLDPQILDFLKSLAAHNSREWMDENRAWYKQMRDSLVDYAGAIQNSFAEVYPMTLMDPKKYLARINNNRRFHPDKPPYKTHFALMVRYRGRGYGDFYIHIQPENCMLATGIYHPHRELLNALRDVIDHQGAELEEIVSAPDFKSQFGELQGDKLKTSPKGFEAEHPYIEFLRHKDMIVTKSISDKLLFSDKGITEVQEAFAAAVPFMEFIDQAIVASQS